MACMGRREVRREFWWGNLKERVHLEDPSTDVKVIIKWILKKIWEEVMEQTDLVQECDKHGAAVNAIKNLWLPQNVHNFLACCGSSAFSIRILFHGIKLHFNIVTSTAPNSSACASCQLYLYIAKVCSICGTTWTLRVFIWRQSNVHSPTETQAVPTKATVCLVFKAAKTHASIKKLVHYRYFEFVGVRFGTGRTQHAPLLTFLAINSLRIGPKFVIFPTVNDMHNIFKLHHSGIILYSLARATTRSSRRCLLSSTISSMTQRTNGFQCRSAEQRKTQRNTAKLSGRMRL